MEFRQIGGTPFSSILSKAYIWCFYARQKGMSQQEATIILSLHNTIILVHKCIMQT